VIIRSRAARGDDAPRICKKCHKALRTRLVDVLNIRTRRAAPGYDLHGNPDNLSIIRACENLIDDVATPAERAERDATLATIRRNLRSAYETETAPRPTCPMTTSPDGDGQLTLF
jgi:hypothetical protein